MTIGERIKGYCKENEITEREFAYQAEMTEVSIMRLIRGDGFPQVKDLSNIVKVLGTKLGEAVADHYETSEQRKSEKTQ